MAESAASDPLCVFVYGSLKRGYRNHQAFCSGFDELRPAIVQGKLFRQAEGYPMLQVPKSSVLALGSGDLAADFVRFHQVKQDWLKQEHAAQGNSPLAAESSSDDWQPIKGEILTWSAEAAENEERLSRLDWLEEFTPTGSNCLYHRAIVLAQHADGREPVWVYIAPDGILPPGSSPMGRSWP